MSKKTNKEDVNFDLTDKSLSKEELEALSASKVADLREKDQKLVDDKEKDKKREERNKKFRNGLKIAAVILFILLLMSRCGNYEMVDINDPKVPLGVQTGVVDKDDIVFETEKEYDARKAMLIMSMNKVPVFENGASEGTLNIENDPRNVYLIYVEIYLNDANGNATDTLIYQSDLIPIGKTLLFDTLDVNLPAGDYDCTAYFNAVEAIDGSTNEVYRLTIDREGKPCNIIEGYMKVSDYYTYIEKGVNIEVLELPENLINAGYTELPETQAEMASEYMNEEVKLSYYEIVESGWGNIQHRSAGKGGARITITIEN